MIYLDYSSTTPVDKRLLEYFSIVNRKFYGNPNSNHQLGIEAAYEIEKATLSIKKSLGLNNEEVIYTSGATEANNLGIIGYALQNSEHGKHLIVSPYEHSSVVSCFNHLEKLGFEVDVLPAHIDGLILLEDLKGKIRKDTILVSISMINSETGIAQAIDDIGKFLKEYPQIAFHVDLTQAIGKIRIDVANIDLFSMAAHKFYGIKGIGALVKKPEIMIVPMIHGGKSTTKYRSGTPATGLILSLAKSLEFAYEDFDQRYNHVLKLKNYLVNELTHFPNIVINSNQYSIPHILNISNLTIESKDIVERLGKQQIYVSAQTACSSDSGYSHMIYRITKDEQRAKTSFRVSLSYKTSLAEVIQFVECLKNEY